MHARSFLLALPASAFLTPSALAQRTIHVPGAAATIQEAIAGAASGDTVVVAPGTYHEQIEFLGKAITVRSAAGAATTVIDSQGAADWPDFPWGPVVRMVSGEGPTSVLEGFTVTGGHSPTGDGGYSGVWCAGLSPTLRDCVITGNSGGIGGGVLGDARIVRCAIVGNDSLPYGDGGGVWGAPTIEDSRIADNHSGGFGGGLYATGPCTLTRTWIDSNVAGNGVDGYSGGGAFGPVSLLDCRITRNAAQHYDSGGPLDTLGTAVDGAVLLSGCTVQGNRVQGPSARSADPGPGDDPSGALKDVGTVTNCILWGDALAEIALGSAPAVSWSIVAGGFDGAGVLDLDPRFRDAAAGDWFLEPSSPAIDAGDPASAPDPDGTRRDLGALAFPQFPASALVRAGSGVNPASLHTVLRPVVGSTFVCWVDTSAHQGALGPAAMVVLLGHLGALDPGLVLPAGELLVELSTPLAAFSSTAPVGGVATHVLPVPPDYALGGLEVSLQAVVLGSPGVGLTNALDLVIGL